MPRLGNEPMGAVHVPHTVIVANVGILTWSDEELVIEPAPAEVGRAVCVVSGGRLAFRRVLEVRGRALRLRADIAPFDERWELPIVGCVKPRWIDRVAAIAPEAWTRANWEAALVYARVLAARSRLARRRQVEFTSRVLEHGEWNRVRDFWREACGRELHAKADAHQFVIGLFDGARLIGANIHLVFGDQSYSAFTLVDRRYRGTGGGLWMIEHSLRVARERKLARMYVHINVRNLPSIRAYQRAGFVKKDWWQDPTDPLASAERQWFVLEHDL